MFYIMYTRQCLKLVYCINYYNLANSVYEKNFLQKVKTFFQNVLHNVYSAMFEIGILHKLL